MATAPITMGPTILPIIMPARCGLESPPLPEPPLEPPPAFAVVVLETRFEVLEAPIGVVEALEVVVLEPPFGVVGAVFGVVDALPAAGKLLIAVLR